MALPPSDPNEQKQVAPAGWYEDPQARDQWRYWDGGAWTDDIAPRASAANVRNRPVTVRYEGPVSGLRDLRRLLETRGLDVRFGTHGLSVQPDPRRPGRSESGHWFQLVVSGEDADGQCRPLVERWKQDGNVWII